MGGRLSGSSHFITQPRAAVGRARRRAGLGSPHQVTLSACPGPARLTAETSLKAHPCKHWTRLCQTRL